MALQLRALHTHDRHREKRTKPRCGCYLREHARVKGAGAGPERATTAGGGGGGSLRAAAEVARSGVALWAPPQL